MLSGEFIVIVAAVLTASHDGRPSSRSVASRSIFLKTLCMFRGAGTGPGRACEAFMRALRAGESLDMVDRFAIVECEGGELELRAGFEETGLGSFVLRVPGARAHINWRMLLMGMKVV